jgi:hypothetical protein
LFRLPGRHFGDNLAQVLNLIHLALSRPELGRELVD